MFLPGCFRQSEAIRAPDGGAGSTLVMSESGSHVASPSVNISPWDQPAGERNSVAQARSERGKEITLLRAQHFIRELPGLPHAHTIAMYDPVQLNRSFNYPKYKS